MRMPLALILIVGVVLLGLLTLSLPSVRLALFRSPAAQTLVVQPLVVQTLGNYVDTDPHAKYFLLLVRQHQYAEARGLMTPRAKTSLTASALKGQWAAFESARGRVSKWTEAGVTENLLPEYVDRRYQVSGSRGSSSLVTLRLTRPAGSPATGSPYAMGAWQIASLTISR